MKDPMAIPEPQGKMACPDCGGYMPDECETCDGCGVMVEKDGAWISLTEYLYGFLVDE